MLDGIDAHIPDVGDSVVSAKPPTRTAAAIEMGAGTHELAMRVTNV